jgi:hypothetical protein
MSLADVLSVVKSLPAADKDQLLRWLQADQASRDADLIFQLIAAAPAQLVRPQFGPEAAIFVERFLAEQSGQPSQLPCPQG